MSGIARLQTREAARPARSKGSVLVCRALAGLGCVWAATPAVGQTLQTSAFASATETYTSNVDYGSRGQTTSDFVTTLSAGINVSWGSPNARIGGSLGASWLIYAKDSSRNSFVVTPNANVNLSGSFELIKNFLWVDASANVTPSFLSPFGPQPGSVVNATDNRYVSQTYQVSPYIKGSLGATGISYNVRIDNIWTVASSYGNSSNNVPTTYVSTLNATLSGTKFCDGGVQYNATLYDGGGTVGGTTSQVLRCINVYQVNPQLQVSGRFGYERFSEDTPTDATGRVVGGSTQGVVYGAGFQWNPTERTQTGGFWEHRFFGSSYSWQLSHRLPNAAITASFTRGLSNYPELALIVPAGTTVNQFLDAAFTTRIPDPTERAKAVAEFLARTGLPPTLASPVNFYAQTILLQNTQTVSLVLLGSRNSLSFTVFNVKSSTVGGSGGELPPAFQFGQNNTQTGIGVGYGRPLGAQTSLGASANYSRTVSNATGASDNLQSRNFNAGVNLNSSLGPKTSASAGISYSWYEPSGFDAGSPTSALNVYAGISHTFW